MISKSPIVREAQGIRVTRYLDGHPATTRVEVIDGVGECSIRLFGRDQARALLWALQDAISSDEDTD